MKQLMSRFGCLMAIAVFLINHAAIAQETVESAESGYRLDIPDVGWTHVTQKDELGMMRVAVGPAAKGGMVQLSIQPTTVADNSVDAIHKTIASLKASVAADPSILSIDSRMFTLGGIKAPGVVVVQEAMGNEYLVHIRFMRARGIQYRVQFHAPRDEFEAEHERAEKILEGFSLIEIDGTTRETARLKALAARCGSQLTWEPNWNEASKKATEQRKLIVVAIHALPGFELGNPLKRGLFTDEDIVALMKHRCVVMEWSRGDDAPFVSHDVFGLSGSTFGSGLLVCTPTGDVVRQIYVPGAALVADALRATLEANPHFAPPPEFPDLTGDELIEALLESGQMHEAERMLARNPDDHHFLRARLHLMQRNGEAARSALRKCEPSAMTALLEAVVAMGVGNEAASASAVSACLEREPDDAQLAEALYLRGGLAWAAGNTDETRELWNELTVEYPNEPVAWIAASMLVGPSLSLGVQPDLSWPDAYSARLAQIPPAAQQNSFDADLALRAAAEWLLAEQQPDGSWIASQKPGTKRKSKDPITLASNAIAISALARAGDASDDPDFTQRCHNAARAGLEAYLQDRKDVRAYPAPVAFMDYTCWGSSYGAFCLAELADHPIVGSDLQDAVRDELSELAADLVRIQQGNGGWSYYLSGSVDGQAAVVAMSFTTATVLLALDDAVGAGATIPDGVLERGRDRLELMRADNGNFEYLRMGATAHQAANVADQGAAARGPVCTYALIQAGRLDADALEKILHPFVAELPTYGDESRKALMHSGPATEGSHYLMYDYSTAANALRNVAVSADIHARAAAAIQQEMARCRSADGSFIDNPLIGPCAGTGLAIWALLDLDAATPRPDRP